MYSRAQFDWATRLSSCGLDLEHVCGVTLPTLHLDKQMMHALEEANISQLLQYVPLLDILRPS